MSRCPCCVCESLRSCPCYCSCCRSCVPSFGYSSLHTSASLPFCRRHRLPYSPAALVVAEAAALRHVRSCAHGGARVCVRVSVCAHVCVSAGGGVGPFRTSVCACVRACVCVCVCVAARLPVFRFVCRLCLSCCMLACLRACLPAFVHPTACACAGRPIH